MLLILILNIPFSSVSVVDFEQVNIIWGVTAQIRTRTQNSLQSGERKLAINLSSQPFTLSSFIILFDMPCSFSETPSNKL